MESETHRWQSERTGHEVHVRVCGHFWTSRFSWTLRAAATI